MHASPEGVVDVDVFVMLQLYIADELSAGLCTHCWSARELMHMPPERAFGHVAVRATIALGLSPPTRVPAVNWLIRAGSHCRSIILICFAIRGLLLVAGATYV